MVVAATRPQSVAFLLVALAAGLVWAGRGVSHRVVGSVKPVPMTVGPWIGKALTVQQRVRDILETDAVAIVEYRQGEAPPIWLAQVSGFGNRAAFHPPELCYVGSHFEVLERGPVTLALNGRSVPVMRLVIRQDAQRFEAWYWFTANGRVTPNYYQQQMWLLTDSMRGKPISGELVRISTPADDAAGANKRLLSFLRFFDSAPTASGT